MVAEVAARAGVNSSTLATWLHQKRLDAVLVANGLPPVGRWPGRWAGAGEGPPEETGVSTIINAYVYNVAQVGVYTVYVAHEIGGQR